MADNRRIYHVFSGKSNLLLTETRLLPVTS